MPSPNEALMMMGADLQGSGVVGAAPWTVVHEPAANTQAVATKAAGAAGVRHMCTAITATIAASAAPTAVVVSVRLRDGAGGPVLWSAVLALTATAGDRSGVAQSGLRIPGSAATAMVLEFSAAGGANTNEAVTLSGVDI